MRPGRRPTEYKLDRPAHYLRASPATGTPKCSVALVVECDYDQETGNPYHRRAILKGWSAVSWGVGAQGQGNTPCAGGMDAPSFFRWLLSLQVRHRGIWIWQLGAVHGLAALGFWDSLELGEWTLPGLQSHGTGQPTIGLPRGLCVLADPPTVVIARRACVSGSVRFVDVRNLGVNDWPEITSWENTAARASALAKWLQEWYAMVCDLKLGGLRGTAASQAWHGWRHNYLTYPLLVHNNERAIAIERAAYHPGRCEATRLGRIKDRVYQLDASAHYPASAVGGGMPCRLERVCSCSLAECERLAQRGYCVIGRAKVRTQVPCVPYRDGGDTIWPVGSFDTVLCWPEIQLVLDSGGTVETGECAVYESACPFDLFYAALWRARQQAQAESNRARVQCIKRLMNSLIGKLAAWDWGWESAPGEVPPGPWAVWYGFEPGSRNVCRYRSIGWHTQWERCRGEAHDSMPALAAWICSVARVRLWNWMEIAGRDNVYYCDTDSLFVSKLGRDRLLASGQLNAGRMGSLRDVACHDWCDFSGIKYYRTPKGLVCAGVSNHWLQQTENGYRYWSPEKVVDSVAHAHAPDARLLPYTVPLERPYRHGIVHNDGRITPFVREG